MSTTTLPPIPRRWLQEPPRRVNRGIGPAPRERRLLLLAAGMLLLCGLAAGMVGLIASVPTPRFVPLWVSEYRSPLAPDNTAAEMDRRALVGRGYFSNTSATAIGSLPRHRLVEELAAVKQMPADEAAVIYISAYAMGNAAGKLCLLPSDFVPGDARSELALADVLTLIENSPSRRKLVVLDLMWPVANFNMGTQLDAAAALAAAEIEKLSGSSMLVLCAASPWQNSLVSPELGRSVFGYYFEQALRGYADGCGAGGRLDGRICARELAAYVSERVDGWVWRNLHQRQTPWLAGCGEDFELFALPHGQPLPSLTPMSERGYPAWLREGWALRDTWKRSGALSLAPRLLARLEYELLVTENAWDVGRDAVRLQSDLKSNLASLTASWKESQACVAGPPPRSLAMLQRQGLSLDPALAQAVDDLLAGLAAQTAGLQGAPALAVREKLIGEFQQQAKAAPAESLALAIFEHLAAETSPLPDEVQLLDSLLAARQPQPQFAETALVRRVASLAAHTPRAAWPTGNVRQALELIQQAEAAVCFRRGWKQAQPLIEQAAVERHCAETILLNPSFAAIDDAAPYWRRSAAAYAKALACLQAKEEPDAKIEEVLSSSPQVATATAIQRLLERLRRADAGPVAIAEAATLLNATGLQAQDRAALWQARQRAALALAWRSHNRDMLGATHAVTDLEALDVQAAQSQELALAQARAARWRKLAQTAGLADTSSDVLPSVALEAQLAKSHDLTEQDRLSRIYPPQLPCRLLDDASTNPTLALRRREALEQWQWLASWYRYRSQDGCGDAFYAEAASDYFGFSRSIAETWIEFGAPRTSASPDSRGAVSLEVPWRIAGPHATGVKVAAELLMPEGSSRQVELMRESLGCGEPASLRVQSIPSAQASAAPPQGCLVQVRFGSRTYHALVPLDDLAGLREWDLALSADPAQARPAAVALRLRPLSDWQPYYIYVQNRSATPRAVIVQLAPGGMASAKATVGAGQWQPVTFSGPAPKEHAELPMLEGPLVARVVDAATNERLTERSFPMGVASPREYVDVQSIQFQPAGLKPNRLAVDLRAAQQFMPPPCQLELVLPSERIEGLRGVKGGVFRGVLAKPNQMLGLFAEGLQLSEETGDEGAVYVNVDACPRAFVFRATLPRDGEPTTPYEDPQPTLRLQAPRLARSGPNISVCLAVDQGPAGSRLLVELGSRRQGVFTTELTREFLGPRQARVGFSPFGAGGSLLFTAEIRDWAAPLDATGIVGRRLLRTRLMGADGQTICAAEQPIVLDDTPPEGVQILDPPTRIAKGQPVMLVARGGDDLSGIVAATFFAGRPVDGKLPSGTPAALGKASDATGTLWAASLELPPDAKGKIPIGVQFTNGVGMSTFASAMIEVVDPATLAMAHVRGRVLEGPRPQAGLEVSLKDEKGTEIAKTKTDDEGGFVFEKVAPGKYSVSSNKLASLRKAEAKVTVEAGTPAVVTLRLEL